MSMITHISTLRSKFSGFNPPAIEKDISSLLDTVGHINDDAIAIYRDHDGSNELPEIGDKRLGARLMPIAEVIQFHEAIRKLPDSFTSVGNIAWLWTDDNSNYAGVYTGGPLRDWICILDHEEPMMTPAFRSIGGFLSRLLSDGMDDSDQSPALPWINRDIPEITSNAATVPDDRALSAHFRQQYINEKNADLRRLFAFCAISLTPTEDTNAVTEFLKDADIWTPEAAVRLLEVRNYKGDVTSLMQLAQHGRPNGDSAAMRLLARMETNESRQALAQLRQTLQGPKLKMLEMWTRVRLQPPRW